MAVESEAVAALLSKYQAGERNFSAIKLSKVDLSGLDLRGANFSRSTLWEVDLSQANLEGLTYSPA